MNEVPVIGGERVESEHGWTSYDYAIGVVTLVRCELSSAAETRRTDVDAIARFADWIRAFDSNRVGEIATTAIAFYLETRFCYGCEHW
jgi:hypothetical protein